MREGYLAWDVPYLQGKAAQARLVHGLLVLGGQLLDSYPLPNYTRDIYHVRIALPHGRADSFRLLTGLRIDTPAGPSISPIINAALEAFSEGDGGDSLEALASDEPPPVG